MRDPDAPPIYQTIVDTFSELGVTDLPRAGTTALIHDLHCIGCRYSFGGVHAVWLIEEDEIHLYGEDDELLKTVDLSQLAAKKQAA